jgi:hypothetical protein
MWTLGNLKQPKAVAVHEDVLMAGNEEVREEGRWSSKEANSLPVWTPDRIPG